MRSSSRLRASSRFNSIFCLVSSSKTILLMSDSPGLGGCGMDTEMNPEELRKLNSRIKSQFAGEFIQMMTEVCAVAIMIILID